MTMLTEVVAGCWLVVVGKLVLLSTNNQLLTTLKIWHFRRDWLFTPFVVVVGGKYFLPAPECLLFDRVYYGSM